MASRSMHLLRKYQKTVLVVMGVILMVTFTVGTSLSYLTDRSGRGKYVDPIVVTWSKGVVRETELHNLRTRHNATRAFLASVIAETLRRGGRPVVDGQVIFDERMFSQMGNVGIPMDDSDPTLINTMLMAEEAQRLGIVVDRVAVIDHLRRLSSPELAEGDWAELLDNVLPENSPIGPDDVLDHLAYELKAQHARMLATAGMEALSPGQVWESFNRLNRRVSIEAFPIEVAPFISRVKGEPTTAEIQKLYDEGRFRDPNPNTHEPGFRKPHKVAFEYAIVKFEPFLEEAQKSITDEQIKKQYDLDISQGKHKDLELPAATPGETPKTPESPGTGTKEGDKPGDVKPGDAKPAGDKPADPKPGEVKPPEAKPVEAKAPDAKPAENKPAENKPADPPAPECQETTGQPPAKSGEAQPPATKAATDKPITDKPTTDKPTTDKPAAEQPVEKPADAKPADAKPGDSKPGEEAPTTAKPGDKPTTEAPKEQKFKPLEKVKDEIRKELAQPIAREARNKAVAELTKAIDAYGNSYRRWITKKEALKDKIDPKSDPGKFDLAAAAAKHGFETGSIPLVDRFEVSKYVLGQKVSSFDFAGGRLQMLTFADIAFGQDEPLFTAREANSTEPDTDYVYFRTAEELGRDVALAEARPQIALAWKHEKAFELALEDARQKAAKAKGASSLGETLVDKSKLLTPAPFSWMTTGSLAFGFGAPEPSRVNGIDLAGREFMQAVFTLKPGETGVAPNQAHTQVYVVRVISEQPDEKQLRAEFLEGGWSFFDNRNPMMAVMQSELMQTAMDWYRGVEERYQVKWQRPPFNPRRRA